MPDAAAEVARPPSPPAPDPLWRTPILEAFSTVTARMIAAFDPDGVLADACLANALRQRGFYLLPWDDPAAFRHRLETEFRSRWNAGEDVRVVAVYAQPAAKPPYDFTRLAPPLAFSVKALFPRLDADVVSALDRADFDAVALADRRREPEPLDESATADFLLQHVYAVTPARLDSPVELLHFLLRQHYVGRPLPPPLCRRVSAWCEARRLCLDWPLERIVPDRFAFFSFLQEHWEAFVRRVSGYRQTPTDGTPVPFEQERIRGYWDSLFHEGWLQPATHCYRPTDAPPWLRAGLHIQTPDPRADRRRADLRRWEGLLFALESGWPTPDARISDMLRFHDLWRQWIALSGELPEDDEIPDNDPAQLHSDNGKDDKKLSPCIPIHNDSEQRLNRQAELRQRWENTVRQWLVFHEAILPFIPVSQQTFAELSW